MTEDSPTLEEYLVELCENQNLSMRRASELAGLDPTTISQIVRRGKTSTPRPDTLRLIADALNGSYDYMMVLAGHLPPRAGNSDLSPHARHQLGELTERLSQLSEERQRVVLDAFLALMQAEAVAGGAPRDVEERNEVEEEEE